MALFSIWINSRWRPPPSWIISNGHISATAHDLYFYSAHRAVIFAIAQLSCLAWGVNISKTVADISKVTINDLSHRLSFDTKIDDLGWPWTLWVWIFREFRGISQTSDAITAKRMKIDQYCQRQLCKHVELEQFVAFFRVARVCQRQLGFLVLASRAKFAKWITILTKNLSCSQKDFRHGHFNFPFTQKWVAKFTVLILVHISLRNYHWVPVYSMLTSLKSKYTTWI